MFSYIIRRILYSVPIIFGVIVITFMLFYVVHTPRSMAVQMLGPKATPLAIQNWLHNRGYDKPVFINTKAGEGLFDSQFFHHIKSPWRSSISANHLKTDEPIIDMFKRGADDSLRC